MSVWTIPIQLLRSITTGTRPATLLAGQIFLNQADGVLCWPGAGNAVIAMGLDGPPVVSVPVAAGTVALLAWKRQVLNPAGTLTTLTVTLPASPVDGQTQFVHATQSITTLTLNGGTIKNAPATLAAGASMGFMWSAAVAAWIKVQ